MFAKKRKRNTGRRRGGRGGSPGGEERGEALADALAAMRGLQKEMGGLRRRVGELEAGKKKANHMATYRRIFCSLFWTLSDNAR